MSPVRGWGLAGFAAGHTQDPWDPLNGVQGSFQPARPCTCAPLPTPLGSGFQRPPQAMPPCCPPQKGCSRSPDPRLRGECKTCEPNTALPRYAHGGPNPPNRMSPSFPGLSPVPCPPRSPKPCVGTSLSHQGPLVRSVGFLARQDSPSPLLPGKGGEAGDQLEEGGTGPSVLTAQFHTAPLFLVGFTVCGPVFPA